MMGTFASVRAAGRAPRQHGALALFMAWLALLAACTVEETVTTRTQVLLNIDTQTDSLREQVDELRVQLYADIDGKWQAGSSEKFVKKELFWPMDLPVLPRNSPHVMRRWEVVVQALAQKRVVAETRAVTTFAINRRVVLTLRLASCQGEQTTCADDECHGADCLVCRVGSCVVTGVTDSNLLPDSDGELEPTDGGVEAGRGRDAMTDGAREREREGGRDATRDDAGDASGPSGRCDDDGQLRCVASGAPERERCVDGSWKRSEPCDDGQVCDPDANAGCRMLVAVCVGSAGKAVCDREVMQFCNDAGEAQMSMGCLSARHCNLGVSAGKCAICLPGEHRCEGAELQVCNEDGTSFKTAETCGSAALCNAAAGSCGMGCAQGAKTCAGDELRACNAERTAFVKEESCEPGLCDAAGGQCDVCVPETKGCEGNSVRTCRPDGQGHEMTPCAAPTRICRGNGLCVQCASNADCPAPSNPCLSAMCEVSSGTCTTMPKAVGATCPTGTCDGEGGCGECLNDETKPCGTNTGECMAGTQTCRSGRWGACTGSTAAQSETCNGRDDDCDGTIDDAASCSGMGARTRCIGGRCVQCGTGAACPSGQSCNAQGSCETQCGNGRLDSGEACDPTAGGNTVFSCSEDCRRRSIYELCTQDEQNPFSPGDCPSDSGTTYVCGGYGSGPTFCVPRGRCPTVTGHRLVATGITAEECLIPCTPGSAGQCPFPVSQCFINPFPNNGVMGWCAR
jgi:hypothetical protein